MSLQFLMKAEELLIERVGEEYYEDYFELDMVDYRFDRPTVYYLFNHPMLLEYSDENTAGRHPVISFERDGSIRGIRAPIKPLYFVISEEQALEIAEDIGITDVAEVKIDYTRQECLPPQDFTKICRAVTIDRYSWIVRAEDTGIVYIDTESGEILYSELEEPGFFKKLLKTFLDLFR